MTTPTPASMGGPLSESERIAEIRRGLKMAKLASANAPGTFWHTFTENTEFLLELVGVLEGQLATAKARHVRERRYTCPDGEGTWGSAEECAADCDIPVESVEHFDICAHCGDMEVHDDEWRCYDWSQWPCADAADLGLDGGDPDE